MRFLYAAIAAISWIVLTANAIDSISLEMRLLMLAIIVAGAMAGGD
jgi:hypothetical protein